MASHSGGTAKRSKADMKRPKSAGWRKHSLPPGTKEEGEEEEEEEREGDEEESEAAEGRRAKRERRQGNGGGSATLCQVCNIRLNSGAQAQIHYRGKTHQRRLRHLSRAVSSGAIAQGHAHHPLLASLPLPGRTLRAPALEFKPFLPLRVSGSSPLNLFPNFNAMDPVQKAVINHTFGVAPPKKRPIISCNICHLRFNSTTQAEAHYKGHKHARKLKALDTQRTRHRNGHTPSAMVRDRDKRAEAEGVLMDTHVADVTGPKTTQAEQGEGSLVAPSTAPQPSPPDTSLVFPQLSLQVSPGSRLSKPTPDSVPVEESSPGHSPAPHPDSQVNSAGGEGEEAKRSSPKQHLHCPLCKVTVNSTSQLEAHYSGSRHKQMLDGQNSGQSQRRVKVMSSPRPAFRAKQWIGSRSRVGVGVPSQPYHCELCQLSVNSELQLKQHISSKRHKERLAGKPAKPKFSPYLKVQPSALLATKLALQKHLSKTLQSGFLTNPFSPATLCTFASGPLALRPQPGPTAILQGPLISPTLFRPAPGPLRATHTPIIFSPY